MSGIERITAERIRQVHEEGWSLRHDDRHETDELARAALCYATPHRDRDEVPVRQGQLGEGWESCSVGEAEFFIPEAWPFSPTDWKPSGGVSAADRLRELAMAGALIAAEMDRLERSMERRRG